MKIPRITSAILLYVIIFISGGCTKNDNGDVIPVDPPFASDSCKLTSILYTPVLNNGTGIVNCTVQYSGNKTCGFDFGNEGSWKFIYNDAGFLKRKEVYFLNNPQLMESHTYDTAWNVGGWFVRSIDSNYFEDRLQPVGLTGFFYHGNYIFDYLTKVLSDNPNNALTQSLSFTWVNGDPVRAEMLEPNNPVPVTDTISYDTTRINPFNKTFPTFMYTGLDAGGSMLGHYPQMMYYHFMSRHLITKVASNGSPYYKALGDFTYTFTSDGMIKEIFLNGKRILLYGYSCD